MEAPLPHTPDAVKNEADALAGPVVNVPLRAAVLRSGTDRRAVRHAVEPRQHVSVDLDLEAEAKAMRSILEDQQKHIAHIDEQVHPHRRKGHLAHRRCDSRRVNDYEKTREHRRPQPRGLSTPARDSSFEQVETAQRK